MDELPKPATDARAETSGILDAIVGVYTHARQAMANFADGLTSDLRRAGLTMMWMVVLGVLVAIFIAGAWFGLMAALALWLVGAGLSWASAVALVAAMNLLAAIIVVAVGVILSRNFLFPATRHQLAARSSSSKET